MRRYTTNPGRRSSSRSPASARGFNANSPRRSGEDEPQEETPERPRPRIYRQLFATATAAPATAPVPAPAPAPVPAPAPAPVLAPAHRTLDLHLSLPSACPTANCPFTLNHSQNGRVFCLGGHYFQVAVALSTLRDAGAPRMLYPFVPRPTAPTPPIEISSDEDESLAYNAGESSDDTEDEAEGPLTIVNPVPNQIAGRCTVCLEDLSVGDPVGNHQHGTGPDTESACVLCWARLSTCPVCRCDCVYIA